MLITWKKRGDSNRPDFTQLSDRACLPAQGPALFFSILLYLEVGSKVCIGAGLEDLGHEDLGLVGLRGYALAPRSNMSWLVPGPSSKL